MSTIKADLLAAWSEFYELAGITITVAGEDYQAIQTAEETEALDAPFDAPSRMWEAEIALRAADAETAALREETLLMWAGKRWRVRAIRRHSASPILLARIVREG